MPSDFMGTPEVSGQRGMMFLRAVRFENRVSEEITRVR